MRRSWTQQEDAVLVKRVKQFGVKAWNRVAEGIPLRTGKSCSERWRHFLDPAVKSPSKEAFSTYEAAVIVRAHAIYGNKWQAIAELLPGRSCRAVKNFYHTNMSPNAVHGGAIMVSNTLLAQGHSLEYLLANRPQPNAALSTASSARLALAISSRAKDQLPTPVSDARSQLLPGVAALPASAAALLSPMHPSHPQLQHLQLLLRQCVQELQHQQMRTQQVSLVPLPALRLPGMASTGTPQQPVMVPQQQTMLTRAATLPLEAMVAMPIEPAVPSQKVLSKRSRSEDLSVRLNSRGDTLCEQLLHGFDAATGPHSPVSANGSGGSSSETGNQSSGGGNSSCNTSTAMTEHAGQVLPAPTEAEATVPLPPPLQLEGHMPPVDAMEVMLDNLNASDLQAMLAEFWGEGVQQQLQAEDVLGSSGHVTAAAVAAPASQFDAVVRGSEALLGRAAAPAAVVACQSCPRCIAEAAASVAAAPASAAAAATATAVARAPATPSLHASTDHARTPWVHPPPLQIPSPVLGSASGDGAGSTSSGNNVTAVKHAVLPQPAVQMQREGSVNSFMTGDGVVDVFQVSCLIVQQQQRLAQQQQELLKQQKQLEALQMQLAQHTEARC